MLRLVRVATPLASGLACTLLCLHAPFAGAQQTCGVRSFGASAGDPLGPDAEWLAQPDGSSLLYGTTPSGGAYNRGTLFSYTPSGGMRVVHSFDGVAGNQARGGLAQGGEGVYYGVTYGGGERAVGTIFATTGGTPSVVFSFKNGFIPPLGRPPTQQEILDSAGSYPIAPPVLAPDGNLYGVTSYAFNQKKGALYRLAGGAYTGLYVFDGTAGSFPSTLTAGTDGNLYGIAQFGRNGNPYGLIFKASIDGGGVSVLYEFDRTHGGYPYSVLYGIDGNLYGTTAGGGLGKAAGMGVVYKLTPAGEITVLHEFNGADGWGPLGGLIEASDQYLYGTTRAGGAEGRGTIFRIRRDGTGFERLHSFTMYQTGRIPVAPLVEYPERTFYGVTSRGGARDYGMLYKLVMPRPGQPEYAKRGVSMLYRPDQYVDLRQGVEVTQRNLATQIVTSVRDAIALEVKCGCGHVVQFVYRQFFGADGVAKKRSVSTSWGSYETTVDDAVWMPDSMSKDVSEPGKRIPYYESSMSFRTDPDLLTIFDAPNFSASVYPGADERSIAVFKSFAICHNQIVREIDWWHEKRGAMDPVYGANPPTRPDMAKWQSVFKPLLVEHGYDVSELP